MLSFISYYIYNICLLSGGGGGGGGFGVGAITAVVVVTVVAIIGILILIVVIVVLTKRRLVLVSCLHTVPPSAPFQCAS